MKWLQLLHELDIRDTAGEVRKKSCDFLQWTPPNGRASVGRLAINYFQQFFQFPCKVEVLLLLLLLFTH